MAQKPAQTCPSCGAPMAEGQRFCTNCGSTIGPEANNPTVAASQSAQAAFPARANLAEFTSAATVPDTDQPPSRSGTIYDQGGITPPPPPPPPYTHYTPGSPGSPQGYPQNPGSSPGGPQNYPQNPNRVPDGPQSYPQNPGSSPNYTAAPVVGAYQQVPAYAQKPKRSRGCLITSIILLVVLAAGIGGFLFLRSRPSTNTTNSNSNSNSNSNNGSTSGSANGVTPTTSVSSSEQLNLKITYASVNITIVSAQEASSFSDDSSSRGTAGVVRVNLQENNTTANNPGYLESDAMLLVLPGGNTVQASNEEQGVSPDAGVNRPNWFDFPLNNQASLSQLTLRIGTASENQMSVPLQPNANISKYQDTTGSPNTQFQYAGLSWTLKTATLSYSYNDKQATTGNLYAILTFSVNNATANSFVDFPSDFMRLQAGGNTVEPESGTTMPVEIASNATASGIVAFLVPQGTTSFTLVMLAQPNSSPAIPQVTQNFSIQ